MKKRKWVLALLVVCVLVLPVAQASAAKKITITWWLNPWRIEPPGFPEGQAVTAEDYPQWVKQEFEKLYPNVEVKYEVVTNAGYEQKISAAILAGNPPDVLRDYSFKKAWAIHGLLEPVDDYVTPEDIADWYPDAWNKALINGKHYLFPWSYGTNGMGSTMLLNPKIFAERGIELPALPYRSWTLDEFLSVAKKLSWDDDGDGVNDHYALGLGAQDSENNPVWLYMHGARMFNEDETEVIIDSPAGIQGLQFMVDMIYEHKIAPPGAEGMGIYDIINLFHSKKTAMGYGGPYEIGRIYRYVNEGKLDEPFEVKIAQFPHIPEIGPVAYHASGGFMVFKQRDSEKKKMVMEFCRFLTNPENTRLLKSLLYITARDSVNQDLYVDSVFADEVSIYANAIQNGHQYYGSLDVDFTPARKFWQAAFEAAFTRDKTPKEALTEFAQEANKVLFKK
ncbi:MAG: sugar ABC transporter substrate-binding protein [Firmicutes bacterium]|nr:sugar ABC transporter substrate-binding protein [Bacillota bacterium]